MTELLVANTAIPIGTRLTADHVRTTPWPVGAVPEGALKDAGAVIGRIARTTIDHNVPVRESQLIAQGMGILPLLIEDGRRAMSVKVDSVTGVSGFITPNSRVDVLVSGMPQTNGDREQRSKVIVQNVRVLATGTTIEQKDEKPVEVPTVTLLVSPEEAEKLTLAARQEPVRLALRNFEDQEVVKTTGISAVTLFASDLPARRAATAGPSKAPMVEVLLGDKVTQQPVL
jgi:pilus assembly protein CpaB